MSELKVIMTGDEAKLWESLQRVVTQSDKIAESAGKNQQASKQAEDAAVKMAKTQAQAARDGARLIDELAKKNETLIGSYDRQKSAIEEAGKQGKKSPEEISKALSQLQQRYDEQSKAAVDAEHAKARAILESTDTFKLQQAEIENGVRVTKQIAKETQTVAQRYDDLRKSVNAAFLEGKVNANDFKRTIDGLNTKQIQDELDLVDDKNREGFGAKAQSEVLAYGAKFLSAAALIKVISSALQQVKKDHEDALNVGSSLEDSRRKLRGLSGNFSELERQADTIAIDTGMDRAAARDLVFTGTSQSVPFSDQMLAAQSSKFADPNVAIAFMADLKDQFKGENLSGEQALNVALTAADVSKFDPTAMLSQMQKAAIGAGVAGFSSVDTGAITGVLASQFGQETGTRVSGLASKIATDDRFTGLDGLEALRQIQQMSKEERTDFVGGDRTMMGTLTTALGSLDTIELVSNRIQGQFQAAGTDRSFVRQKMAETFDPTTLEGQRATLERTRDQALRINEMDQEQLQFKALKGQIDSTLRGVENRMDRRSGAFLTTPINETLTFFDWTQSGILGTERMQSLRTGISDEFRDQLLNQSVEFQKQHLEATKQQTIETKSGLNDVSKKLDQIPAVTGL